MLFATYLTEKFHEVIFSDSFQGEGYTYIVAGDGDVISSYGDGMQKNMIIFSYIQVMRHNMTMPYRKKLKMICGRSLAGLV